MLTPFGGHESGPVANLAWGAANLSTAVALVTYAKNARIRSPRGGVRRAVVPFVLGCATFEVWALVYENLLAKKV